MHRYVLYLGKAQGTFVLIGYLVLSMSTYLHHEVARVSGAAERELEGTQRYKEGAAERELKGTQRRDTHESRRVCVASRMHRNQESK